MQFSNLLVFTTCVFALWAGGAGAAVRYDTATPYTPPYKKFKYPTMSNADFDSDAGGAAIEEAPSQWGMPPSEIFLTGLRTILDVVRNINKKKAMTRASAVQARNSTALIVRSSAKNITGDRARGFEDYYDEHHHDETTTTTTTEKPMKQGRYTDPWAGYYDWLINEGSFKFWSVFQLFTAGILLYACLSAIYYAKFNPIMPDYSMEYDDYFLERTVGRQARSLDQSLRPSGLSWMNSATFQFIIDAIARHYVDE